MYKLFIFLYALSLSIFNIEKVQPILLGTFFLSYKETSIFKRTKVLIIKMSPKINILEGMDNPQETKLILLEKKIIGRILRD
jgi:hypothetical protein